MKRLYKSNKNKIFAGVVGGIGEYFNIDPVVLRVLWVFLIVFTGLAPGIIVYLLAMVVMPIDPNN